MADFIGSGFRSILKSIIPDEKLNLASEGRLSKPGEKLKGDLLESITTQEFPGALRSRSIGDAFREDILNRRSFRKGLSSIGVGDKDVTRSPLTPLLKGSTQNVRLAGRGVGAGFETEKKFEANRRSNLQGFLDIELGGAALPAQVDFLNQASSRLTEARRGAFVGNIARLASG